jgi:hypothetical protein
MKVLFFSPLDVISCIFIKNQMVIKCMDFCPRFSFSSVNLCVSFMLILICFVYYSFVAYFEFRTRYSQGPTPSDLLLSFCFHILMFPELPKILPSLRIKPSKHETTSYLNHNILPLVCHKAKSIWYISITPHSLISSNIVQQPTFRVTSEIDGNS